MKTRLITNPDSGRSYMTLESGRLVTEGKLKELTSEFIAGNTDMFAAKCRAVGFSDQDFEFLLSNFAQTSDLGAKD